MHVDPFNSTCPPNMLLEEHMLLLNHLVSSNYSRDTLMHRYMYY
jgi:hypothetical protein